MTQTIEGSTVDAKRENPTPVVVVIDQQEKPECLSIQDSECLLPTMQVID